MKKALLLSFFCLPSALIFAQNAPIDFETGGYGASWTWTVFENVDNPALEIIANPDMDAVNGSATVAKFTAREAGQPWAGCESLHGSDIGQYTLTPETSVIKIMVWKSTISDVGIKLVEPGNGSLGEIKIANTVVNQWEEITFDFSSREGTLFDQIVIFPDFYDRPTDNICYFDNITFGSQTANPIPTPLTAAPDPTIPDSLVISMFSDVYTDVAVDTWQTVWSSAALNEIEINGNPTKKYSQLDFVGIETVGANLIDASNMTNFHLDFWSHNITEFRIKLVDFGADGAFEGGDDSEHQITFTPTALEEWVSFDIPMSDFTGLTSSGHIAQLILSCLPVGGGVAYIDNVYYSRPPIVSVGEINAATFDIYPNPTQNNLRITANSPVERVEVYNLIGERVADIQPMAKNTNIDLATQSQGIYLVKVTINGQTSVRKVVKN